MLFISIANNKYATAKVDENCSELDFCRGSDVNYPGFIGGHNKVNGVRIINNRMETDDGSNAADE
jgi:hypothetical protein